MKRTSILALAAFTAALQACTAGNRTASLPVRGAGVHTLAIAQMNADERRVALRPSLPAGTKVFAIETYTFAVGSNQFVTPVASVLSMDGGTVTYRTANGEIKTLNGVRLLARDRSEEMYVKPGHDVPPELANRTPNEVVR
jgi:hypothetical protein